MSIYTHKHDSPLIGFLVVVLLLVEYKRQMKFIKLPPTKTFPKYSQTKSQVISPSLLLENTLMLSEFCSNNNLKIINKTTYSECAYRGTVLSSLHALSHFHSNKKSCYHYFMVRITEVK